MILERFYEEKLAQASYLIGCAATGEALVVDPNRDVQQYIRAAEAEDLHITHVTETHIHADFVSGSRELCARTGAKLCLSDEGGDDWRYAFAREDGAVLLRDGDGFRVGNIRIDVLHTPGHTPEHLIFLVTDTAAADRPIGALTGDFLFVGDVGRPDLLEKAAKIKGTMESSARELFRSLQRFKDQPDWLQIWPGHGAGSACGKGLSSIPQSTAGYERLFNWGLEYEEEDAFVRAVLEGQPEPPRYFAEMKRINRDGPPVLGAFPTLLRLEDGGLAETLGRGATIVDTRPASEYAHAHVPGTINIPLDRSFTTWAGWLVPYDRELYLIVDDRSGRVGEAVSDLCKIGLERIGGLFAADAVRGWKTSGRRLGSVPQITAEELSARMEADEVVVLDVRGHAEWAAGHLPGVRNIPVGYLTDHLSEIPSDRPVVLQCESGGRSSIGASVLRSKGLTNVANLTGGFAAWKEAGLPTEAGAVSGDGTATARAPR
ncbi:MAG: rhodanese-like domain-containing protein [Gemmatimonadota bacterium]